MISQLNNRPILKVVLLAIIALSAFGCNDNNDEEEQRNPNDWDGDGVTNQQEAVDNTDAENPCSVRISSQFYPSVSENWKGFDCDGDGVTNWRELDPDGNNEVEDNGTDPLNDCSLVLEDQTREPQPSWFIRDCDNDGVDNQQELIDGTNVLDPCDLNLASQLEIPTTGWQLGDCDNDGYPNGREVEDNTDFLDPTDFDGSGSVLSRMDYGNRSLRFINNGTRYDKIVTEANESVVTSFEYDGQGNLISVINTEYDNWYDLNIFYTYNSNNQITHVLRTFQSGPDYSYDVVYGDNEIFVYDGTEPEERFTRKLIFNSNDILIGVERYYPFGPEGNFVFETETYTYDASFENILSVTTEGTQGYNEDTEQFFTLSPSVQYTNVLTFSYEQTNGTVDVLNPLYEADQDIKLNILLDIRMCFLGINVNYDEDYTSNEVNFGNIFFQYGVLSKKFIARREWRFEGRNGQIRDGFYRWVPTYVQNNDLPIRANTTGLSPVFFFYD